MPREPKTGSLGGALKDAGVKAEDFKAPNISIRARQVAQYVAEAFNTVLSGQAVANQSITDPDEIKRAGFVELKQTAYISADNQDDPDTLVRAVAQPMGLLLDQVRELADDSYLAFAPIAVADKDKLAANFTAVNVTIGVRLSWNASVRAIACELYAMILTNKSQR